MHSPLHAVLCAAAHVRVFVFMISTQVANYVLQLRIDKNSSYECCVLQFLNPNFDAKPFLLLPSSCPLSSLSPTWLLAKYSASLGASLPTAFWLRFGDAWELFSIC